MAMGKAYSTTGPEVTVHSKPEKKIPETFLSYRKTLFEKYPITTTTSPRQAWVEDLSSTKWTPGSGHLVELHPEIWAVRPRLDILYDNVAWQEKYKTVGWNYVKDRYELPRQMIGRPWPQKGMGRARHATDRSPLWIQGGKAHGPKAPTVNFFMLPYHLRIAGLTHALSSKFAQDDVRIVRDLEIPTEDPKYIEDMINTRNWGISVLFSCSNDIFPRNITAATSEILHTNLMPVYGLNVTSLLKHKTLVITLDALNRIEDRILFAIHRMDAAAKTERASTHGYYV